MNKPGGFRPALLAALGVLALAGCCCVPDLRVPPEPRAEQRPFTVTSPQGDREDPWFWLRDDSRQDPEVLAYLAAENRYYEAWAARSEGPVETLFTEILGRVEQDDASVPVFDNGYWYYTRYEAGREHPIHARRRGTMEAPEEILLDGNAMALGHAYFRLGDWAVSDDNRLLAWLEDITGRGQFVLRVREIESGQMLLDGIGGVSSFAWSADNRHLFYVENHPQTLLPYRLRRHALGSETADLLVYEERDEGFYTSVIRSRSRDYVLLLLDSTESSEVRMLPATAPDGEFAVFMPRQRGHLYAVDHLPGRWIVRSNLEAPNFRLFTVAEGQEGERAEWRDLVPHDPDVLIEDFQVFRDFLAIGERSGGLRRLRVLPWEDEARYLEFDEPAYTARLAGNPTLDTRRLRYIYTSLTTPLSVYEFDLDTGERTLLKREPVRGEFDPADYVAERLWAPARDGAQVPVSVVYRRGLALDGTAPLLLHGYGAYGISQDPAFNSARLSLLDRGFVFALAHVRGGQEMGRHWYEEGRLLNKKNTFRDFIDVTRFLVESGYAAPDGVYASGGSAGGLLVGAVVNKAPELYAGVIARVPFVDIVSTMLDESIPLTTEEFDEWGNPKLDPWYEYMLSYSPYDNVAPQDYPAMLVVTGFHDSQVQYWEPAKWVARLRATRTNDAPLLFRTTMEAGHSGRSGRFERLREVAGEFAFLLYLEQQRH